MDTPSSLTNMRQMVLLTGGLFRNVWLIRELKAELEHQFVDIIVNYYGEERAGDGQVSSSGRKVHAVLTRCAVKRQSPAEAC